jgi:hypothetical protein
MSISNGANADHDASGQFKKGWRGGPGNPQVRRLALLRAVVTAAVAPDDMMEVMVALLDKAKAGEMAAIRELFDRTLGPSIPFDVMAKLEDLQAAIDQRIPELRDKLKLALEEVARLKRGREKTEQAPQPTVPE